MSIARYHLGGPLWGAKVWQGSLFSASARPATYLDEYARVFNTVEGNTTFYRSPTVDTSARWAAAVPPEFRFCFKLDRGITHERQLSGTEALVQRFLAGLAPLAGRLGPLFVQLPASFGPDRLTTLASFLDGLPPDLPRAVEVRHPAFFTGGPAERALDALLGERGVDRAVMDTRPLRAAPPPLDEATRQAQQKKPDLPVRPIGLARHPFIRYVAHPDAAANGPWLAAWAEVVAGWIAEGRDPYVFIHSPGDVDVPQLARRFHRMLRERGAPVGEMPPWPGEEGPPQLSLI
ncbi:MAG: DUF72 domain-containing protein [Myxococcales bacterium]|nr:DUF72 domain-containing protein [Myxococcales bacterium]